jgi:hypothetical protein
MLFSIKSRMTIAVAAALLCSGANAQEQDAKAPQTREVRGLPPRTTPGDYQAHASAGKVTIGAEFSGHSISTAETLLTTEDYVVVEVGLFGAPSETLRLSFEDFSIRINGKKPEQAEPYGLVFNSLKDPNWLPPETAKSESKTSFGGGGQSDLGAAKPTPPKPPIKVERAMEQKVQKASLPEGDRPLPEAGLIFFPHRGKTENLRSIELIYSGPGGKATMALQP